MSILSPCKPYIAAALARSEEGYTFDDVARMVESGEAILCPAEKSAAVTRVRQIKAMHIWAAGGDINELRDMSHAAEKLSRDLGCEAIMACGREGWARALRPIGYRHYVLKEW